MSTKTDQVLNQAESQAIGYVWGRQDMGEAGDTYRSLEFGRAYRERKRAYMDEETYWMPNIQDAYEEWARTGTISLER